MDKRFIENDPFIRFNNKNLYFNLYFKDCIFSMKNTSYLFICRDDYDNVYAVFNVYKNDKENFLICQIDEHIINNMLASKISIRKAVFESKGIWLVDKDKAKKNWWYESKQYDDVVDYISCIYLYIKDLEVFFRMPRNEQ